MRPLLIALLALIIAPITAWSQAVSPQFYNYPNQHLAWFTIESEHFLVHFQDGNERPALLISRIAEEIYPPITSLYGVKPDKKTSIVLKDREDYSNGAAYFFDNKIDIWLPALDTPLRGTHNWLRNVITHEFTHIVQILASMHRKRSVPAMYIQWLNYENVRRPDVLYGFPNGIASFPLASVSVPAWLAEGTAQYQLGELTYDEWDAHRDMILRTRVLSNTLLDLDRMGSFSTKTSIEREVTYNQGFAFTIYLAERFGESILATIAEKMREESPDNIRVVLKRATGIDGKQLYNEWVSWLKERYQHATDSLRYTPYEFIEEKGFFNFHPRQSADGKKLAYLSNKGRDYSRVSLVVKHLETKEEFIVSTHSDLFMQHEHTLSCGHSVNANLRIGNAGYAFSEDGNTLVYARQTVNAYGEEYNDVFVYDFTTKKSKQLTKGARITDPAFSPNGKWISGIQLKDGTFNLVLLNADSGEISTLTQFSNSEQLFVPVWHPDGTRLFFAYAREKNRSLRYFDVETMQMGNIGQPVAWDERDPFFHEGWLYYSSNETGIFNLYRKHLSTGAKEQLSSVTGGAFQPMVAQDGSLVFSVYEHDGYKIAQQAIVADSTSGAYKRSWGDKQPDGKWAHLNVYNDTQVPTFSVDIKQLKREEKHRFELSTRDAKDERNIYKYQDVYNGFSFFPALRFDNYSKLNGSNGRLLTSGRMTDLSENIWRDQKVGFYFANRDALDRLSLFGGLLFGFGSQPIAGIGDFMAPGRIAKLDRDLFLIAEYAGLPFIDTYWSPTVSVELYNLKRNVAEGLSIEEIPCNSCLPDTSRVDLAYDIWQADVYLRSKLNRFSLLELGMSYSPYRVTVEPFYSREFQENVPGSTSEYFRGTTLSASYIIHLDEPWIHADVAPIGIRGYLRYAFQPSSLLDRYDIKDGMLVPVYRNYRNHSIEANFRYGFRALDQAFQVNTRFFNYFSDPDQFFFMDYIGGLIGMRSYPFFALGGNTTWWSQFSWNMPLFQNVSRQVNRFTINKVYTRFFAEAGNAWGGVFPTGNNLKRGLGAELRFSFDTQYLFPSRFFLSGSYGLDRFTVRLPEDSGFVTANGSNVIRYGGEWLFHFGLLFDFEL